LRRPYGGADRVSGPVNPTGYRAEMAQTHGYPQRDTRRGQASALAPHRFGFSSLDQLM
jgi:hypothetical protein